MFQWFKNLRARPPRPGGVREVWQIAAPIIISMASLTIMQFCDRIFLAQHSSISLRAALPAGALAFTLTTFFQALAGYASTFVAQYHGARRKKECTRATEQGIWLALLTWPIGAALIPLGYAILVASDHPADVLAAERIYLTISMLGCGVFSLNHAVSGFFTGRGDTRTPMMTSMFASALNVVLDYALIFGKWGFPEWGIGGAAIATIFSGAVGTATLFALYWRKPFRKEYGTWPLRLPQKHYLFPLFRFGLPHSLNSVLDVGAFALFVVLLGSQSVSAADTAANTIGFSINNIAFMPLLGMGMAATILVGQYQGARDSATAQRAGLSALKVGWAFMAVLGLTFILFPTIYLSLFTGEGEGQVRLDEIFRSGRILLLMMAAWGLVDTINIVISGALKGAGDTRFTLLYGTLMTWGLWMPGEWVIIKWLGWGLIPAWLFMTTFTFLFALGYWLRWTGGRWKKIKMIDTTPRILEPEPIHNYISGS